MTGGGIMVNNQDLLRQKRLVLSFHDPKSLEAVAYALDSSIRLKILYLLAKKSYTIYEIADAVNISISNASFHIKLLREAGLINTTHNSSKKGNEKIIALEKHCIEVYFDDDSELKSMTNNQTYSCELPIGSFSNFDISGYCGMADEHGILIGPESNPEVFYSYRKNEAEIIWFTQGFIEYYVPNIDYKNKVLDSIEISMEICSECANYNNNYKSDITFILNDKKVGIYTSPGDFGGRRGLNNPANWPDASTQYGRLVQIRVDNKGCFINQVLINNNLNINDFQFIANEHCLKIKFGVSKDSKYVGGINLFGKKFGDYSQGIRIVVSYK